MNITSKLNRLFSEKGISQRKMAECIGVRPNTVGDWLSGASEPQPKYLSAIAAHFGVPVSALTASTEAAPAPAPLPAESSELVAARARIALLELQIKEAELRAHLAQLQTAASPASIPVTPAPAQSSPAEQLPAHRAPFTVTSGTPPAPPVFASRPAMPFCAPPAPSRGSGHRSAPRQGSARH